ncbi:hypothetical protein C405_14593 [Stenotrophomonas maltophilia AU12-09]|uniref:hypothetical protein n=1 Tax=Stenotrophomonas maltophilia TaxID=40324 RepID=UPI0002BFD9F2|nr:hypothetical protein [Stenotrophomonas maltophilia]EMI48760.1 hypothetical protein C405_14593 [Stenotrophomonas maltophilia AU12-09]
MSAPLDVLAAMDCAAKELRAQPSVEHWIPETLEQARAKVAAYEQAVIALTAPANRAAATLEVLRYPRMVADAKDLRAAIARLKGGEV